MVRTPFASLWLEDMTADARLVALVIRLLAAYVVVPLLTHVMELSVVWEQNAKFN